MKASGRFAVIIATTVWMCGWGLAPVTATAANDQTSASGDRTVGKPLSLQKPAKSHHAAKHTSAPRHAAKPKTTATTKAATTSAAAVANADAEDSAGLPPHVANANAEMPAAAADAPSALLAQAEAARQNAAKAASAPVADVVAPDQINDVDLAANVEQAPSGAATVAKASSELAAPENATQAKNDDSLWGNTSLIGKIFIAFGGLLTVASAARMFIA